MRTISSQANGIPSLFPCQCPVYVPDGAGGKPAGSRFFSRTGAAAFGQRRDAAFPVMCFRPGANEAAPARLYRGVCKTVKYAKGVTKAVMPFAL